MLYVNFTYVFNLIFCRLKSTSLMIEWLQWLKNLGSRIIDYDLLNYRKMSVLGYYRIHLLANMYFTMWNKIDENY